MKISKVFLLSVLCSLSITAFGQVSFGQAQKINGDWKFILSDVKEAQSQQFDDKRWQKIDLPHDWSVKGQLSPTLASCTGFLPG